MNKKTLVLIGIILLLSIYLTVKKLYNPSDLPELNNKNIQANMLEIQKPSETIKIFKEGEKWFVGEKKYPADKARINEILRQVKSFSIEDLISEKKYFERYELTKEKLTSIALFKDKKLLLKIYIGKKHPSGASSFITLKKDGTIYLVANIFRESFNHDINFFRDKEIFNIPKHAITSFDVKYQNRNFMFYQKKIIEKKTLNKKNKKSEKTKPTKKTIWTIRGDEYSTFNQAKIKSFLNAFAPLTSDGFADEKTVINKRAFITIKIKAFSKDIKLEIFSMGKGKKFLAKSTESPYIYKISEWKIKKFQINNIEKFKNKK